MRRTKYLRHHLLALLLAPALLHGQLPLPAQRPQAADLPRLLPVPQYVRAAATTIPAGSAPRAGNQRPPAAEEDGGRWRPALAASAGLAVTGAVVAYWSSHKADAAYNRYLHSAGAARQQDALDRSERYDRLAGAAFLVMEAGLVLTARFLFF